MAVWWLKSPEIEWYSSHDCPVCGVQTLLEGIVVRRFIGAVVIPIPIWRDWYVRCRSCRTMWKMDKAAWRSLAKSASKPEDLYRQQQEAAAVTRAALPARLRQQVDKLERKGWTFASNTDDTASLWRETEAMLVEWLRVTVDDKGRPINEEKWVE